MSLKAQAITGGNLFIAGIGLMGELVDFEPPKFEHETIEASAEIGKYEIVLPTLKPLSAKFTINNVSAVYFALLNTKIKQSLYVKANHTDGEGAATQVVATFSGNIKVLEPPKFEMNKEANLSIEMNCYFCKYDVDKKPVLIYDVDNKIYAVDGIDLYESIRKNIS
ncbi:phage major tail tube protein [uncultured Campylobacter sp.]|jgi:phage tail tube protein FII|uniref:phage major tail tube protein n=1 Tax=uncultured Campylobacter sp. TaxID=218934 RepID=UPI00204522A2|nr:phage major tail tube protein [uncultured Campylobacter sp.]DAK09879.1 MAG TPA: tail tube protein [Caudoviricetes sp.]DAS13654.1 MAG TPA: tail tube protein [Caudoviricetes sp.]DAW74232.1 MAG TPA: tail tube protein [Caudoviricetes sp.]